MELKDRQIFGRLGSLTLADIVQILGVNKRTATLVLEHNGQKGKIFFKGGVVLHAYVGDVQGEAAILKFMEWVGADFAIEEGIATIPLVTMFADAEAIMLKMASRLDEANKEGSVSKAPSSPPTRPRAAPKKTRPVSRKNRIERVFPSLVGEPERKRLSAPVIVVLAFVLISVPLYLSTKFLMSPRASAANQPPTEIATAPSLPAPTPDETVTPLEQASAVLIDNPGNVLTAADIDGGSSTTNEPSATAPGTTSSRPAPQATPASVAAASEPAFGYLLVVVEPMGKVSVDGKNVGETPLGRIRLPAGPHTLTLSNDDFAGIITEKIAIPVNATLSKRYSFNDHGYLQIVVIPWADVYIDGEHVGQTPLGKLKVPTGRHTVELRHPQLGNKQRPVDIRSRETTLLKLEM